MKIGIIGAGQIGGTLARRLSALGHQVRIANSRGPDSLGEFASETGAVAATVHEAARNGEIVFITIPQKNIPRLPNDLFDGVDPGIVVVDTGNYYPRERDGRIDAIENGRPESLWMSDQIGRPVVKAFNTLHWRSLLEDGKRSGSSGRIGLPVAGDQTAAKTKVIGLIDELGFDGVDAGPLDQSWRQQPGTPVYAANLPGEEIPDALKRASPARTREFSVAAE